MFVSVGPYLCVSVPVSVFVHLHVCIFVFSLVSLPVSVHLCVCISAQVIAAARLADAYNFIIALPSGFQTLLGHGGINLSGGQKQRLNVARAILKNPSLLILDEFSSALDNPSEAALASALSTMMQGRTTVSVAHRLGALAHVDKLIVFSKVNCS